jgi:hypothetical protein
MMENWQRAFIAQTRQRLLGRIGRKFQIERSRNINSFPPVISSTRYLQEAYVQDYSAVTLLS